jgi:hypothetical protein
MRERKKKKIFLIPAVLLLLLILGTAGIYASNHEAVNKVDTGVVNVHITEYTLNDEGEEVPWIDGVGVLPGMVVSKIPYFTATGNDCYVRATINVEGIPEHAEQITFENFDGISDKWIKIGDYYYYKEPLKTNESVDFFHSFEIPNWNDDVKPSNIGEWGFAVTVVVDAVQSDNFTPDFENDAPWGDITIKESIHKDGYDVNIFTTNSETNMSIVVEDYNNILVKPDDFFEGFKTMVPGDILTDSIEINSKKHCELFFTTESLEDLDMLQKLGLKIVLTKDGKDIIVYDGTLDADINKMSLGKFKRNETGILTFTVSMPAELDNEYTLRNASVKWSFEAKSLGISGDDIMTGDNAPLMLLMVSIVISGLLIVILVIKRRKSDNKTEVETEVSSEEANEEQ